MIQLHLVVHRASYKSPKVLKMTSTRFQYTLQIVSRFHACAIHYISDQGVQGQSVKVQVDAISNLVLK